MRLPRLHLSVRWVMAVVALVALGLVFVLPACQRMIWLYQNPANVRQFSTSILWKPATSQPPQAKPANWSYPVGRPFSVEVTSNGSPATWLPAGLTYRLDVEVKITDPTTFATVYQTQRRSRQVVTGSGSSGGERETAIFDVVPAKAGAYALRYGLYMNDVLGRRNMGASATLLFNAY